MIIEALWIYSTSSELFSKSFGNLSTTFCNIIYSHLKLGGLDNNTDDNYISFCWGNKIEEKRSYFKFSEKLYLHQSFKL